MRVLVGSDGSPSADLALALVAGLAWPAPSECRIVVAFGAPIVTDAPGMVAGAGTLETIYEVEKSDAERLATAVCRRVDRPDLAATWEVGFELRADTTVRQGDPATGDPGGRR